MTNPLFTTASCHKTEGRPDNRDGGGCDRNQLSPTNHEGQSGENELNPSLLLTFKRVAHANIGSNKKEDMLPYTPKCVNIRKVHLNKIGYKCLMEWNLNPKNIYIRRDMTHYVK